MMVLLSDRATVRRSPGAALETPLGRAMVKGRSWWPSWNRDCEVCFLFHCGIAFIWHSDRGYQELY